jgi:hypothetical protein
MPESHCVSPHFTKQYVHDAIKRDIILMKPSPPLSAAQLFHTRLIYTLFLRGAMMGLLWGLFATGLCIMGLRFVNADLARGTLILGALGASVLIATLAGLIAAQQAPSLAKCVTALDEASQAGGLFMSSTLNGAEAWPTPKPVIPQIAWQDRRLRGGLALAVIFCLVVIALPRKIFINPLGEKASLASVVNEVKDQAALLEAEKLLPPEQAAALSNELAKIAETGDATDPARVMEALDHLQNEMQRMAQEKADALTGEQAELQAAMALVSMLSERMENLTSPANPMNGANEALAQLFANSKLPPDLASNLLARVTQAGSLSPATLAELSKLLSEAGALNEAQLKKLSEMNLAELQEGQLSECEGGSGSCTNGAACAAALAKMLGEEGQAAEAAACLVALAGNKPGQGGVSRGRGDAMLTWTDPSTKENVTFKEEVLRPSRRPDPKQAKLEGVSAAAPEVSATAAAVASGALTTEGSARGVTPQTVILPRHKESVKRFFGDTTPANGVGTKQDK